MNPLHLAASILNHAVMQVCRVCDTDRRGCGRDPSADSVRDGLGLFFRVILMTGKYVSFMEVSVQFSSLAGSVESSLSSARW